MSETTQVQTRQPNPLAEMRRDIERMAAANLVRLMGTEEGQRASVRVGMAFAAAVRAAKDPKALMGCSRESIATAVAMSALTGLMPGGPAPAVWLVPKGRDLQWWLSHRGITTLCLRAGYQILPVAVHRDDVLEVEFGEVTKHVSTTAPTGFNDLAGVYLTVRRLDTGIVLCRPWISGDTIQIRSQVRDAGPVWRQWPVEMAQKTAIRWAIARGLLPIEGMDLNIALGGEPEEIVEREEVEVRRVNPAETGRPSLAPSSRIPDDHQIPEPAPDFSEEAAAAEAAAEAELVEAPREEPTRTRRPRAGQQTLSPVDDGSDL